VTGREKIEAALSPGGIDEVPVVICYEDIYYRDHWDELVPLPWWYRFSPNVEDQMTWQRQAVTKTPQDWFSLDSCASRAEREATRIEERPDGVFLVNADTGSRTRLQRPTIGGWNPTAISRHVEPPHLPETVEQVDALIAPAPRFDAESFIADGRGDLAWAMLADFGRELFPMGYTTSPLWRCYYLWGFEGLMVLVAERPDLVRHACHRLLDHCIAQVRQAAALGAAAIFIEECMTDMVSPAAYGQLNVPITRRLIDEIRSLGMKSVFYYCGDPAGKWDHLFAVGADALSLEEGKKGFEIDIEEIVERAAGRCAILGNLDAVGVLQEGDDEQLKSEITRQIAAGRRNGGRFIMSIGSPVTPGTPVERVQQYCRMVHECT
jgi:hypothetical protein